MGDLWSEKTSKLTARLFHATQTGKKACCSRMQDIQFTQIDEKFFCESRKLPSHVRSVPHFMLPQKVLLLCNKTECHRNSEGLLKHQANK